MADDVDKPEATAAAAADTKTPEKAPSRGSRWWSLLLVVLVVEFYVYGSRAEIQVCVGKQGQHDFALLGQERDDSNRWKFPRCETRENLGLRSTYDEMVEDAAKGACRGQTMLRNKGEGKTCLEQKDGWSHQVESSFIPPWDRRYYQHLLWFLY
ncbi:MAG: hypothetical protein ACE37F_31245 [Nannocystaceae bacterium]|nr:hypothetical protein [bacterium]